MRSFTEFLRKTSRRLLLSPKRLSALEALDPSRIYVENVRALLGVSTRFAKLLCELAVRQGFFERRIQVLCPDHVVAAEAQSITKLPAEVHCWREVDGDYKEAVFMTENLEKLEFYVYKSESAA